MTELKDDFRGDDSLLISCIEALICMSDAGALVPHGIGGHARSLLSAAAVRLAPATLAQQPQGEAPQKLFGFDVVVDGSLPPGTAEIRGAQAKPAPIGYINPDDLARPTVALRRFRNSLCGISMPVYAAPPQSASVASNVSRWMRVDGDYLYISRCNWIYPNATEDHAGERDERRYAAVDHCDGDMVLSFNGAYGDAKDLATMLSWPVAAAPKCFKCGHAEHSDSCVNVAPGAGAQQAEPATPLWMIHIEGPDDLVAAPTKKEAERIATAINAVHDNWATKRRAEIAASGGNPDHYPTTRAVVVPFDGPAQDHAASLAADWDGYVEYVEARAILAQAAPSADEKCRTCGHASHPGTSCVNVAPSASAQQAEQDEDDEESGDAQAAVRWDLFPGWLIDHCEGDTITEELLQHALADMLKVYPVAPAPGASPAALTDTYVQTVPEHCDRIVWRNAYYHLPLAAAPAALTERFERIKRLALDAGGQGALPVPQSLRKIVRECLDGVALLAASPADQGEDARDARMKLKIRDEVQLILTDPDSDLSNGAKRALKFIEAAMSASKEGA